MGDCYSPRELGGLYICDIYMFNAPLRWKWLFRIGQRGVRGGWSLYVGAIQVGRVLWSCALLIWHFTECYDYDFSTNFWKEWGTNEGMETASFSGMTYGFCIGLLGMNLVHCWQWHPLKAPLRGVYVSLKRVLYKDLGVNWSINDCGHWWPSFSPIKIYNVSHKCHICLANMTIWQEVFVLH